MTLLYDGSVFLRHDTGSHPECAARVAAISNGLCEAKLDVRCSHPKWTPADRDDLGRVHDLGYVDSVRKFAKDSPGYIEADTVVSSASYDVAISAAGAGVDAVRRVVTGDDRQAICLTRPPGHHALKGSAMGFCLFNNVAVAARMATASLNLDRILIVDWDVHHGNGTQDAFWEDEQVGFLSIHRSPFYPGTGLKDETGSGKGLGTIRNLPISFGITRKEYLNRFTQELGEFADKLKPQLVLVSAGFDSHALDPVGSLGLEVEDFGDLTKAVLQVADQHADGRIVSMLEGGYNIEVLPRCVAAHLETMLGHETHKEP